MTSDLTNCPDLSCGVAPGNPHGPSCDVARCALTGEQREGCDHPDDTCNTIWTGLWPGEEECFEYGFLHYPDSTAPPGSQPLPDLVRLHLECDWDPTRQRMVPRPT